MLSRKSFTLIEVMIVLMIVVSFLAIAWPRMRRLAGKTEIRQAAVDFQSACRTARDQAVRRGKIVQVRFRWGQATYSLIEPAMPARSIEVDSSPEDPLVITTDSTSGSSDSPVTLGVANEPYELPAGIVFVDPDAHRSLGAWAEEQPADLLDDSVSGKTVGGEIAVEDVIQIGPRDTPDQSNDESINFYPEGRSDSARIHLLAPDTGDSIQLQLRGLTGELSIGDVAKRLDSANEF